MNPLYVVLICAAIAVIPYLLGSINFAIITSWVISKTDIRTYGSGNAGMTNVLRTFGKLPALVTLLGDFGKSVLGVVIARWLFSFLGIPDFDGAYIGGLFALLGHIYPVFFKFKGGKGVMTCCGILAVVQPICLAIALAVFGIVVLLTRYVSLGSIVGAVTFPISVGIVNGFAGRPVPWEMLFASLFAFIIISRHGSNIKRLLSGTENKVSLHRKPKAEPTDDDMSTKDRA